MRRHAVVGLVFIVFLSILIVLCARHWVAPLPVAQQQRWKAIAKWIKRASL